MQQDSNQRNKLITDANAMSAAIENLPAMLPDREAMTLIPWKDIWSSLRIAKQRGNGEMIEVFYDTLFKDAIFDDNGAWSWDITKRT
jgi:hypothetical protein